MKVNQWRNTREVIDWFEGITDKDKYRFVVFDIKDFYPSITKTLLSDAIHFATQHLEIKEDDIKTIFHAQKSLLFDTSKQTWMKKGGELFDVTMGAYDGAEVCEVVGLFMLNKINAIYPNNVGLYRDDGLAAFKDTSGPAMERIKKKIQALFQECGLKIVIECNKKIVNFLDITLNLDNGTFKPYSKPDNIIQYIHTQSNHPPNVIKQIPITIEQRLSEHSSNEQIFNEVAPIYEKALKESGHDVKLQYQERKKAVSKLAENKKRKRNIIWFNPPYNVNVSTKIGKLFLLLIDKHFPKQNKLHKIFNRNNVKVSYSCTKNMKAYINIHNNKIINNNDTVMDRNCNCIKKEQCPVENKCLTKNIIYKATTNSNIPNYERKVYIGLAATTFKQRYANHKKSFNTAKYKKDTELSKEVWRIKDKNYTPLITWKIIRQCNELVPNSKAIKCNLCLAEKLEIAMYDNNNLLNTRSELISKCRHINKYKLFQNDTKD